MKSLTSDNKNASLLSSEDVRMCLLRDFPRANPKGNPTEEESSTKIISPTWQELIQMGWI